MPSITGNSQNSLAPDVTPSHIVLIHFMQALGYPDDYVPGICFGVSLMAMQAILADDMEHFIRRFEVMQELDAEAHAIHSLDKEENMGDFIYEQIEAVKNKIKNGMTFDELNEREQCILEIPAFCDGLALYQSTQEYNELFDRPGNLSDYRLALPVLAPKALEGKAVSHSDTVSGSYNPDDLTKTLESLIETIESKKITDPVILTLTGGLHAITVSYHQGKWLYIDANYLPPKIEGLPSTQKTAEAICKTFSDNDRAVSATKIHIEQDISQKENRAQALLEAWQENPTWQKIHRPQDRTALTKKDSFGFDLLAFSCYVHDTKTVEFLLQEKIDLNDTTTLPPLHRALDIRNRGDDIIALLVQHGADPNLVADGMSPLTLAVKSNYTENVHALIANGATVKLTDEYGEPYIAQAVKARNIAMVDLFIEQGVDVTSSDLSLLTPAAENNDIAMVEHLLSKGADPNTYGEWHTTALHIAINNGNVFMMSILLDHGANWEIKEAIFGLNALDLALQYQGDNKAALLDELIPKIWFHQTIASDQYLLLEKAVINNNANAFQKILEVSGAIHATEGDGYHILHYLQQTGNTDLREILINFITSNPDSAEANCDVLFAKDTYDNTPLHYALNQLKNNPDDLSDLKYLIDYIPNSVDYLKKNTDGDSILSLAIATNQHRLVSLAVQHHHLTPPSPELDDYLKTLSLDDIAKNRHLSRYYHEHKDKLTSSSAAIALMLKQHPAQETAKPKAAVSTDATTTVIAPDNPSDKTEEAAKDQSQPQRPDLSPATRPLSRRG